MTWSSESRSGPAGSAGRSASRIWALSRRPRIGIVWPIALEVPAVDDEVEVAPAFDRDPSRDQQVRLRQQRVDPVVDQLRLDRVLLVDDHLDPRRARAQRRERVDPVDQVGGQDQRRQHVAGADLVDRLSPALYTDALDPPADPVVDPDRRQLLPADRHPRPAWDLVEEGDARLPRLARDRETDQDRDQHRVGDQQHGLQRRAAQDLQVLEQQPAHQCPRWWR